LTVPWAKAVTHYEYGWPRSLGVHEGYDKLAIAQKVAMTYHDVHNIIIKNELYVLKSKRIEFIAECKDSTIWRKPRICQRSRPGLYYRGCSNTSPNRATRDQAEDHIKIIQGMFHTVGGILSLKDGWQLNRPISPSDTWKFIRGNRSDLGHHLCFEPDVKQNIAIVYNISCTDRIRDVAPIVNKIFICPKNCVPATTTRGKAAICEIAITANVMDRTIGGTVVISPDETHTFTKSEEFCYNPVKIPPKGIRN